MFWILLVAHLLAAGAALTHLAMLEKRPPEQWAWLLALLLLPGLGIVLYLILAIDRPQLHAIAGARGSRQRDHAGFTIEPRHLLDEPPAGAFGDCLRSLQGINRLAPTRGNRFEVLIEASAYYPRLEQTLEQAGRQVWVMSYIWRSDRFGTQIRDLLVAAARRGVEVRVLIDDLGSREIRPDFFAPLLEAGGAFSWTSTVDRGRWRLLPNLRNHRKIFLIDQRIAYTGGLNIGDEYREGWHGHPWHDIQVEVTGPVARQLGAVFAEDWWLATEEFIEPAAPAPRAEPDGRTLMQVIAGGPDQLPSGNALSMLSVINAAGEKLVMSTPFLVPDEQMLNALELAVCRGVRVSIYVSSACDTPLVTSLGRSYHRRLLRMGVRVFEYNRGIHHGKCIMVDDAWAVIGSINLDHRSFHLNYELSVLIDDPQAVEALAAAIDRHPCHEVQLTSLRKTPVGERLKQGLLRLLAPVM